MNTSAYADTAVRESPFFYYMYKKNLSFTFSYMYDNKKSSAHAKLFVKNLSCTLFLCFFLVKLLLSRVCFLVNITDFVDTKMEIHLCRRNIGMSHHLLDAL